MNCDFQNEDAHDDPETLSSHDKTTDDGPRVATPSQGVVG
jgi:hypothetical protein